MIVVDFVETVRQQMQLLYYRGEYIVAIKMCLGRLWSFTFSLGARYDLQKERNWAPFLNGRYKYRAKKVFSSLQYSAEAGTQQRFPPTFTKNTSLATQDESTFKYLEKQSKWCYKICISQIILGELESYRNYKGFRQYYFPDNFIIMQFNVFSDSSFHFISESKKFRLPFF